MKQFKDICREAAGEGAVLLKNDHQLLPIKKDEVISMFGRCQIDTYRSGTGSGGSVNVPYSVSILDGIRNSKSITLNEELVTVYEHWIRENPFDDGGGGWAAEPWNQKEMPLTQTMVKEARKNSEKAMVIIGRTAGEDKDNEEKEGSYLLTQQEKENIDMITRYFHQVAVILNTANIMDMSWINEYEQIQSVLYIWQGGMEGGNAAADLLSGKVTPSGKLPDTIAYKLSDYPSSNNFGNLDKNYYQEDIYVGYRYFETFCPKKVQYPFGFGLSYTQFKIDLLKVKHFTMEEESLIQIEAEVTNTGTTYSGREVVQVYYSAPEGLLGKPKKELIGFQKTGLIKPSMSEVVTITINVNDMASYDDSGITGHKSCYVLEKGIYKLYVGANVKDVEQVRFKGAEFKIDELIVTRRLTKALSPLESFDRIKPKKEAGTYQITYENVPIRDYDIKNRIIQNLPDIIEQTGDQGYKLTDVYKQKVSLEDFVAQLSTEELAILVRGEGMGSKKVTLGTASAFAGVGDCLLDYGIPAACCADGPSGARIESGVYNTQVPIGTALSSSFHPELIQELYSFLGQELLENEVDTLLGPGINIHRHPLNGRNFEYFSEDPLLTGKFAVSIVKGLREKGVEATVKHFSTNNQETNRHNVESIVSERALREIYLKPFEIAVKQGNVKSVMTTYNPLNGYWTASNYDLNTTILRNEWKFDGIVMTDWWAKMNDVIEGGESTKTNTASMVRAQNDLYMVVNNDGAEINSYQDNIMESIQNQTLTIGELQRCAMNILKFVMQVPVLKRPMKDRKAIQKYHAKDEQDLRDIIEIPKNNKLLYEENKTYHLNIQQKGIYSINASMYYQNPDYFQSSCNLYFNGKLLATVSLNGTNGERIRQKLVQAELEKGIYELTFEYVKPGLTFEYLEFTYEK